MKEEWGGGSERERGGGPGGGGEGGELVVDGQKTDQQANRQRNTHTDR